VTIQRDTDIGRECTIYPFAFVGGDPQDRKYQGEKTFLRIGDRTIIREMATIHRGTGNGGGMTRIGNDCLIMGTVHVAHDCWIGDDVIIANAAMLAGHIRIEDGANIGGGAGLHHFTTVGTCAFVAAMARVPKDVPPYMLVEGSPAEPRKVNDVLLKRRGVANESVEAIKDAFKRLYRDNGSPMADKIIDLRREYSGIPEICRLCDSLAASAEGVHGRALEVNRPDDKWTAPIPEAVITRVSSATVRQ
jgi:UDP-N-acetylglucosamine acyltransferase